MYPKQFCRKEYGKGKINIEDYDHSPVLILPSTNLFESK